MGARTLCWILLRRFALPDNHDGQVIHNSQFTIYYLLFRRLEDDVTYFFVEDGRLRQGPTPPAHAQPILAADKMVLPPIITDLHRQFRAWGDIGLSTGAILPARTWISPVGKLAFDFEEGAKPTQLVSNVGQAPELAAWLVLLDKFMETFVVVARARGVWSPDELGGALTFTSPGYLPLVLIAHPPDNWQRVAHGLAQAVADRPLADDSSERH